MTNPIKSQLVFAGLVTLGSIQMLGDVMAMPALKAIGAGLTASPAPKVFTAQEGFETYSSQFFLLWENGDQQLMELQLTPERYQKLKGPYNRRNAYGAVISYAPVLYANDITREMLLSAIDYGFCRGDLLTELDIPASGNLRGFRLQARNEAKDVDSVWRLDYVMNCSTGELL